MGVEPNATCDIFLKYGDILGRYTNLHVLCNAFGGMDRPERRRDLTPCTEL